MPEIRTKMTADTSQFERAMKSAQKTATSTSKSASRGFSGVASSLGSVASKAGAAGAVLGSVAVAIGAMSGKNMDLVTNSFEKMANSFQTDSEKMLIALRKVSHGMITDFELMQGASRAMLLGLDPTMIVKLLEGAAASAKATGQTVTEAFNDVTLGVARQSRMILDNLGIIVKVEDAQKRYAAQLGVTASQLTEAQKRTAFMTAVTEALDRQVNILGTDTEGMFTETATLLATSKNAWNEFATVAMGALNSVSRVMNNVINSFKELYREIKGLPQETAEAASQTGMDIMKTAGKKGYPEEHTGKLNGTGTQAVHDQAKIAEQQAKEYDRMFTEISKVIDKHTKSEEELLIKKYDGQITLAKGNAELMKELEVAKNYELAALKQQQREADAALLNEQRQELLSRRDQEMEELNNWLSRVQESETLSQESRLEAERLYRERKQAIIDESNEIELEKAAKLAEQQAQLEKAKKDEEARQHAIRMQGLEAFGNMALKHGGKVGEKLFLMTKGVAAAQAIVDTHAAVMKTMAAVPYPFNVPLAAAQAAIGASNVASIVSTAIGQTSVSASTGGGGGANVPTTAAGSVTPTAPGREDEKSGTYTINIMGDIMNEDYVDLLAERISDAVQDRNVVLKASEARSVRR